MSCELFNRTLKRNEIKKIWYLEDSIDSNNGNDFLPEQIYKSPMIKLCQYHGGQITHKTPRLSSHKIVLQHLSLGVCEGGVLDAPIKTINNEVHYQVWKKTCVLDTQAKKLAYLPR